MLNKTIESELHIAASKRTWLIYILINVAGLIYTFATLFTILMHRPNIYMMIGLIALILVGNWWVRKVLGETQSVMAELMMDNDSLLISYNNVKCGDKSVKITVSVPYDQIQQIEYSERLNAFRFIGKFEVHMDGRKVEITRANDWVLFVKSADLLVAEFEKSTNRNIISVGSKIEKWGMKIKNLQEQE